MGKPRVLFLDQSGALGGAELYLWDVARHYPSSGRVVLFEEGPFQRKLAADGIDVQVLEAPPGLRGIRKQGGLRQAVAALGGVGRLVLRTARMARNFDVLFANSQKALIVAALAGLMARRPVIWNLHDILTADHFSAFNRRVAIFCANHLTRRVIVNSRATQRAFAESGGDVRKTAVVYNGIDAAPFEEAAGEGRPLRRDLGLDGAPVVGVFSRLAEWKGQHVLLEALADVPGLHALLVGEALFEGDERYAERLHRLAERRGIADRVHFLGFRDDVPQLMRAVDVVAHTSVAPEPFGRVIVEGMLAEKPVVAARAGGAVEIVDHGNTGLLVEPDDPEALAGTLRRLMQAPEARRRALAAAGRREAAGRFSVSAMIEGVEAQIGAVASGERRSY
jgi:glycosyltransferase involved in cell wall biosynthesis